MKTIATFLVFAFMMQSQFSLFCQTNTDKIIRAYELRMDGQTEEAIQLLSNVIESDATNAMAHFEMARALDNDAANDHIIKALEYDPTNLAYKFYQANLQMLEAYKAMKTNDKELITENLDLCIATLNSILAIQPDCKETLMFLIEIYGVLPEDMGGNIAMAETYLTTLKTVDPLYAAQGELILQFKKGEVDMVTYWKTYMDNYGQSNDALIKLGKAYLMSDDTEKAKECFEKVIKSDPTQTILYLDVARAHLYTAMRGGEQKETLNKFKQSIHLYLDAEVDKPKLIEAWCYGWLGMIEEKHGKKKLAKKYRAKAEQLMPNYPRFTAIPIIDQPPNEMTYQYKSYFSPF